MPKNTIKLGKNCESHRHLMWLWYLLLLPSGHQSRIILTCHNIVAQAISEKREAIARALHSYKGEGIITTPEHHHHHESLL